MTLVPRFVDVLPELDQIKTGEVWISHKFRTINLRCPCGCGDLTVLSMHPSRWHVHYDGQAVTLCGPTDLCRPAGGSVWANSGCGSHYFIRDNTVQRSYRISSDRHAEYARLEQEQLLNPAREAQPIRKRLANALRRLVPLRRHRSP